MSSRDFHLSAELEDSIQAKVAAGRYESATELIRAALLSLEREEQADAAKLERLRAEIDAGDASGIATEDPFLQIRATFARQR